MDLAYFIILGVLLIIVITLSLNSDMLRNVVFDVQTMNAIALQKGKKSKPAFSLAKTQLAFWSVIIIGSYVYVAFFTPGSNGIKFYVNINAVNLTLLGIAAGTTVIGKAIDGNQQTNTTPDKDKQQNQPGTGFFFTDIISDETGVSIHRLQNVIWTAVVGVIYITYVYSNCILPDDKIITNTLMGLMGISSIAYLGVKTKENTAPQPQPEPGDDGNGGGGNGGGGNAGAGNGGGGNAGVGNGGGGNAGAGNAGAGNAGAGN
ncbi:MAG: hypothetical protein JWP37_4295, partial [Mucilaginibacter sp.]|nr:hypothetical protein [Mucilaginibacter sp.]